MPSFGSVDFLEFDSLLSDEEKLARKTARQFVDEKVLPIIVRHDREGTFPIELVPEMAQLGFFGANLKGYGCAEMSNVEYGVVMQELERGDSGLRSFVSVQFTHSARTRRNKSGCRCCNRAKRLAALGSPNLNLARIPAPC